MSEKSIIEKLDIEPIDISWFDDKDHVLLEEVRKVEEERDELFKALISAIFALEKSKFPCLNIEISVIEKVAEKSWNEIKGFI